MEYNIYMWAAKALGDLRDLRLNEGEPSRVAPSAVPSQEISEEKLA
jgi:hypothetical protein